MYMYIFFKCDFSLDTTTGVSSAVVEKIEVTENYHLGLYSIRHFQNVISRDGRVENVRSHDLKCENMKNIWIYLYGKCHKSWPERRKYYEKATFKNRHKVMIEKANKRKILRFFIKTSSWVKVYYHPGCFRSNDATAGVVLETQSCFKKDITGGCYTPYTLILS